MELKSGQECLGNYSCGRCGLPKKGHNCNFLKDIGDNSTPISTPASAPAPAADDSIINISYVSVSESAARPLPPLGSWRALSFDDDISEADSRGELELGCYEGELYIDPDMLRKFPASCLWEVLMRLPPVGLLSAAMVCNGWRETKKKLWRAAEEL
ncbi:F-box/LRR-repeat protein 17 [Forsythia ovata]|uniref:F-box/LRR-repeat protein 17 n=1 Tax=Forsythia ovata TaxID=205694 RepID=A0ABD1T741_9LAMI